MAAVGPGLACSHTGSWGQAITSYICLYSILQAITSYICLYSLLPTQQLATQPCRPRGDQGAECRAGVVELGRRRAEQSRAENRELGAGSREKGWWRRLWEWWGSRVQSCSGRVWPPWWLGQGGSWPGPLPVPAAGTDIPTGQSGATSQHCCCHAVPCSAAAVQRCCRQLYNLGRETA